MIDTGTDDHIDRTCWLPPEAPLITPEREAKGDMRIERDAETMAIKYAQACVRNILNFLWEKDIITNDHHDAGNIFWAWRNQHRVAMGQQRAISGEDQQTNSVKLRAYGYVLIIQRLSLMDYNAIDDAIETYESDYTRFSALQRRQTYRRALDRLCEVLPPIRDRIAYLESASEEIRNDLSDEALKKLLAEISGLS